jgi:CheY-like chemotaxis protein
MDCNMPVMDGFEATRSIRNVLKDTAQAKQPVIAALTAYRAEEFEQKCYESGMDRFLTKPIDFGKLKELLLELRLIRPE